MASVVLTLPISPVVKRARSLSRCPSPVIVAVIVEPADEEVDADISSISAFHARYTSAVATFAHTLPSTHLPLHYPALVSRLAQCYTGSDESFDLRLELVCVYARRVAAFHDALHALVAQEKKPIPQTKSMKTPVAFAIAYAKVLMHCSYHAPKQWWQQYATRLHAVVMQYRGPACDEFRTTMELATYAATYIQSFDAMLHTVERAYDVDSDDESLY